MNRASSIIRPTVEGKLMALFKTLQQEIPKIK